MFQVRRLIFSILYHPISSWVIFISLVLFYTQKGKFCTWLSFLKRALSIRWKIRVWMSGIFRWRMKQHFPKFPEKIPEISRIFGWMIRYSKIQRTVFWICWKLSHEASLPVLVELKSKAPQCLRWLKAVSSTFQDVDFDVSLLPLVINWCYNNGIKKLPSDWWTRWYHFRDTIGYHSNTMTC